MSRVAVVTGGTRGIGEAISASLKKAGYKVAANYMGNDERAKAFSEKHHIPVYKFDVADFIPQRLKVTLTAQEKLLHANDDFHLKAEVRFLYGAPAGGLSGDGSAKLTADPQPFPEFSKYQFGRIDDSFSDVDVTVNVPDTDATGITEASGSVGAIADTTLPLKLAAKVSIHEPGGRTTDKTVEVPVRTHDVAIGMRPDFDDDSVAEQSKAGFELIAVNGDGKRIALSGLTYSWVREVTTYQWYQDSGEWKYQSVTRDRLVTNGTFVLTW